jgi:hypothetical protein
MKTNAKTVVIKGKRLIHIFIVIILLVVSVQIPWAHSADPMSNMPTGTQGTTGQPTQGTGWGWQQPLGTTGPMMGSGTMGSGMGCGGMGGMMGQGGMGMNMDQPMTMREILYIISMQDALQIVKDVLSIQEKILTTNSQKDKGALLKEIKSSQERLTKLLSDYRGMLTGKIKSD